MVHFPVTMLVTCNASFSRALSFSLTVIMPHPPSSGLAVIKVLQSLQIVSGSMSDVYFMRMSSAALYKLKGALAVKSLIL
jgi:hypothetical protein